MVKEPIFYSAIWLKYDQGENQVGKLRKRQMPHIKQAEHVRNDRKDQKENEAQRFLT